MKTLKSYIREAFEFSSIQIHTFDKISSAVGKPNKTVNSEVVDLTVEMLKKTHKKLAMIYINNQHQNASAFGIDDDGQLYFARGEADCREAIETIEGDMKYFKFALKNNVDQEVSRQDQLPPQWRDD